MKYSNCSLVPSLLAKNLIWYLSCWKQPKSNVKLSNQDIQWNLVNCLYILHVIVVVKNSNTEQNSANHCWYLQIAWQVWEYFWGSKSACEIGVTLKKCWHETQVSSWYCAPIGFLYKHFWIVLDRCYIYETHFV